MSLLLRWIVAAQVAGLACAAPTSGAGIAAVTTPAERPAAARASNDESRTGDVRKGETERDVVAKLFLASNHDPDVPVVRMANAAYPWIVTGSLYWVYERDRVLVVAAFGDGKPPRRLTGDLPAVADFISKQSGGRFVGVAAIAQLLKDIASGPPAVIGTADLLLDQEDLRDWMQGREKKPAVFKTFCTGIRGGRREDEWQLQFNAFSTKGGVDAVSASGTVSPFTIRQFTVTPLKPAGEFHYPFAR
jgi:hypothetical protein